MMYKKGFFPGYRKSVLKTYGDDLQKRWVVEYWVHSEEHKKLIRKQIFISSKKYPSAGERNAYADRTITEINIKLQNGAFFGRNENELDLHKAIFNFIDHKKKNIIDIQAYEQLLYKIFLSFFSKNETQLKFTNFTRSDIVIFIDECQRKFDLGNSTRNFKRNMIYNYFEFYVD
ncbi:MAG: hypothetical protein KTR26_19155 [Flammeovirgaceae bacterium]|nr:hypothetical protein [Flammeovirgaceae bacterium]